MILVVNIPLTFHLPKRIRRQLPTGRDWIVVAIGAFLGLLLVRGVQLIRLHDIPLANNTPQITTPWIPDTVKRWQTPIDEAAKKYNIDPDVIAIIMTMESGGYTKADSGEAQGLMQITPLTAKDIAARHLKKPTTKYDLWDPHTNIEFGAAYLAYLRDTFGSSDQSPSWNTTVELIAAGYNGGPGAASALNKGEGLRDMQTVSYSRDAFNMWRERHAKTSPTYQRWLDRGGSDLVSKAQAER
jgi:soluble lytic murein transglycosylase